ncbi:unnamed protein product [Hymenolepis diminuta]|uniref:Uncharacterized protein n=1 Tax=Hymenolepis diminuta TaxID=6216 RepID=A0A564YW88_HYMDI|nr:unnamed protein product [Hymenolepis diminuta]
MHIILIGLSNGDANEIPRHGSPDLFIYISTSTKDSEDRVKNIATLHHDPLIGETFTT